MISKLTIVTSESMVIFRVATLNLKGKKNPSQLKRKEKFLFISQEAIMLYAEDPIRAVEGNCYAILE